MYQVRSCNSGRVSIKKSSGRINSRTNIQTLTDILQEAYSRGRIVQPCRKRCATNGYRDDDGHIARAVEARGHSEIDGINAWFRHHRKGEYIRLSRRDASHSDRDHRGRRYIRDSGHLNTEDRRNTNTAANFNGRDRERFAGMNPVRHVLDIRPSACFRNHSNIKDVGPCRNDRNGSAYDRTLIVDHDRVLHTGNGACQERRHDERDLMAIDAF